MCGAMGCVRTPSAWSTPASAWRPGTPSPPRDRGRALRWLARWPDRRGSSRPRSFRSRGAGAPVQHPDWARPTGHVVLAGRPVPRAGRHYPGGGPRQMRDRPWPCTGGGPRTDPKAVGPAAIRGQLPAPPQTDGTVGRGLPRHARRLRGHGHRLIGRGRRPGWARSTPQRRVFRPWAVASSAAAPRRGRARPAAWIGGCDCTSAHITRRASCAVWPGRDSAGNVPWTPAVDGCNGLHLSLSPDGDAFADVQQAVTANALSISPHFYAARWVDSKTLVGRPYQQLGG